MFVGSRFHAFISIVLITFQFALGNALNGQLMRNISEQLSEDLGEISHDELGIDYIKKIYNTFKYTSSVIDANKTINEIARKLEVKIDDIFSALALAKLDIENMQLLNNATRSSLLPCTPDSSINYTNTNEIKPTDNLMILYNISKNQLKIDYIVQKMKSKIWPIKNVIKQQYFISSYDLNPFSQSPFDECNGIDHNLLWNSYMGRNSYAPKHIVLVFDHGGSLSPHHFHIVKLIAKQVVASLSEEDKIAVLAISSSWSTPELGDECLVSNQVTGSSHHLPNFTAINSNKRKLVNRFIDGISKGNGATNHSVAFKQVFRIIEESQVQNRTVMVFYISRGLLWSLTEARAVLEIISLLSANATCPFIINTCAVIDENRPTIYETQFLEDIALQNYEKYNISYLHSVQRGAMVAINSSQTVGFAISSFFSIYNSDASYNLKPKISYPIWDSVSKDLAISFSIGCCAYNQFGLLGIDAYFINFTEEIINFNINKNNRYIFMIDVQGRAIIHPLFASLITVRQQLNFVDISYFEAELSADFIQNRLLKEKHGSHQINNFQQTITYTWSRIKNWYIIALVDRNAENAQFPYSVDWPGNNETYDIKLVFQHFYDEPKLCKHHNQIATIGAGSLYLSNSCFKSSSSLKQSKNPETIMSYLHDRTKSIENPGLKDEIKDEVAALSHILNYLRNQHLNSPRSKYIIRRYVASYSGVLEMYPATILAESFNPTKRSWFLQALEHSHEIIVTPPYLDEGGAGYIVTMAFATSDAVVGIDVTYGFVYRLLLKRMPSCQLANITCFLMDDRGYLAYHPNLIEPDGRGPLEKQHIIHKELLVANDILNNKLFIQKYLCNSYSDGTIQRFYRLNTSYDSVLINTVQGEQCVHYKIATIGGSNIFVGVVNATCSLVVTFCPCSIVDRLCLNCNRMEQKECECPCECPLLEGECASENPICAWFPDEVARFQETSCAEELRECFPTNCGAEADHLGCLGLAGCEWCRYDVDRRILTSPYCANMAACFNGVVGARTPYNGVDSGQEPAFDVRISFLTIFLVGVLVVLAGVWFYSRRGGRAGNERLYLSSMVDNHLRMSDLNLSDNYHTVGSHRDKLLEGKRKSCRLDPVSPYCVTSGYRRPFLPADSDHGYSTMTQNDESEHMSLAPVEPESVDDGLGAEELARVKERARVGVGGRVAAGQTCVPKNCIIVPVTVHCNKEAT